MIHRAAHDDNFSVINNDILRDDRLSLSARGFFVYLLSLPDDWNFNIRGLTNQLGLGSDTILRLIGELKRCGYLEIKRDRNEGGKFTACEWEVYETPHSGFTTSGKNRIRSNHVLVYPHVEKPNILNTNNNKILNIQNTNGTKEARFKKPSVEEVRSYCIERDNGIDPETFINFYESKGWKVGRSPMKDWRAAVRTWEKRHPKKADKSNEFLKLLNEWEGADHG